MYKVNFNTGRRSNGMTRFKTTAELADFLCQITESANRDGYGGSYIAWSGLDRESFVSPSYELDLVQLKTDEEFIDFCLTMYQSIPASENEPGQPASVTVNDREGELFHTEAGARWLGGRGLVRPSAFAYLKYFDKVRAHERRHKN